jgi:Zn-dependent peptidase ImmA (M78 family)
VQLSPRFKMDGFSGATTFTHGRYLIIVNKNDGHVRRRFTLAHEFKHLLDYTAAPVIHRALGHGDTERQGQQIEAICNHFAASLLMPRNWVKRAWGNGIQDVNALAGLFNVSDEAMDKRLRFLGFIDDDPRPVKTYFRRAVFGLPAAA